MMWPFLLLSLMDFGGNVVPAISPPTEATSLQEVRVVHGYLDAHWEYPNFLPDDLLNETALPFRFDEPQWAEYYAKPVAEWMRDHPNENVCFRVIGEGYIAPRKPTGMWPAKRQFVFTKILEMSKMHNAAECVKRLNPDGS